MNDFTESESVGALVIIILSLLLTTSFTAARLWAKRLIENWHVEDCMDKCTVPMCLID